MERGTVTGDQEHPQGAVAWLPVWSNVWVRYLCPSLKCIVLSRKTQHLESNQNFVSGSVAANAEPVSSKLINFPDNPLSDGPESASIACG